jgi:hypothetical protein
MLSQRLAQCPPMLRPVPWQVPWSSTIIDDTLPCSRHRMALPLSASPPRPWHQHGFPHCSTFRDPPMTVPALTAGQSPIRIPSPSTPDHTLPCSFSSTPAIPHHTLPPVRPHPFSNPPLSFTLIAVLRHTSNLLIIRPSSLSFSSPCALLISCKINSILSQLQDTRSSTP